MGTSCFWVILMFPLLMNLEEVFKPALIRHKLLYSLTLVTDYCLPAIRAFVSKQADVIDVGLEGFLAAAATQTLHEVFISSVNDPENYSELSDYRKQLSKFLSTIGSHKPDESTMIKNRLSKKLDFEKELKEKKLRLP